MKHLLLLLCLASAALGQGTFWRASRPELPPYPMNPNTSAPLTQIGTNEFVVDDTPQTMTLMSAGPMTRSSVTNPPPPGGGGSAYGAADGWWGPYFPLGPARSVYVMAIVGKPINWNYVRPPAGGGYYMGTNNWTYWPLQPMAWSFWVAGSMVSSGGTGSDYSHTPFGANYQTPYVFTPGIDNGWGVGIHAQFPFPIYGGTFYGEPFAEVAFFGWDPNGNAFAKVITVGFPEPGTCYGEIDILATPGVDPSLYSMVRFIDNSCLSRPYTNDLPRFNGHYPPDIIFYGRPDWWDHRPGSGTDDGGPIVPGGFMPVGIVNCATGVTMSVQSKTPTGSWTTITNVVTTAAMFGTNGWDNSTARVTILNQTNGTKKFYRAYGTNYGPLW